MEQVPNASYTELVLEEIDFTPESVLDVGCGSLGINTLVKKNFPDAKVVACDLSIEQLTLAMRLAKELKLDIDYQYVDMGGVFPYPDKSFDIVIATAVLMMVPERTALNAINNMKRVAKKKIIIAELHGDHMGDCEIAFGTTDSRYARDYTKYFLNKELKIKEVIGWPGDAYHKNGSVISINL